MSITAHLFERIQMLAIRLDKVHAIILEDVESKDPIAQILLNDRSPVQYIDLIVDAPKDKVLVYRKEVGRKIEKIGENILTSKKGVV